MASITESTPGHYDVIIRDVSKFTSVVDEQTPGNDDDTMIINTGHTLWDSRSTRGNQNCIAETPRAEERNLMRGIIKLGLVTVAGLIMSASALTAQAADNVPSAQPKGCHGAATVAYKQAVTDAGGQGSAIGGLGNSDVDSTNILGQAHSALGRGQTLQQFLAAQCDLGSQAVN